MQRVRSPELVPEESEPIWSRGANSIISKSIGMKSKVHSFGNRIYDYLGDPRIGPALLLSSLMSFATIYIMRSQPARPKPSDQQSQSSTKVSDG